MKRPTMMMMHANAKGTGCALELELNPAQVMGDTCCREGFIRMRLSAQKTIGSRTDGAYVPATFDYPGGVRLCLRFDQLCEILQVLRGEYESLEDGKGIYFRSSDGTTQTVLLFAHKIEPVSGYALDAVQTDAKDGTEKQWRFFMSNAEAIGICAAIEGAMTCIVFGVPAVLLEQADAKEVE